MVYFYQLFLNIDDVTLKLYTSLCQKAKCTLFVWSTVGETSHLPRPVLTLTLSKWWRLEWSENEAKEGGTTSVYIVTLLISNQLVCVVSFPGLPAV